MRVSDPTAIGPPVWRGPSGTRRRDIDWNDPFSRLALCHFGSVSGEALLAISLAGTLFFSVSNPAAGREKVLLGLLLTMAPFALVGPLIGPMIDRAPGGRRAVIITTFALRSVIAVAMVVAVINDSLLLFPEAFLMLVLGKTYQVAKAALVPSTVDGDAALVEANSHLQLLSGLASIVAGLPGAVLAWISPGASLAVTALIFAATAVAAFGLTSEPVPQPVEADLSISESDEEARRRRAGAELRSAAVMSAATAMAILRAMVGLITFALAFALRGDVDPASAPPKWHFGVVIVVSVLGGLAGASIAPRLRRAFPEERILLGATAFAALVGLTSLLVDGLLQDVVVAAGVTIASTTGKQAFDALVQRDAPDADRGRLFARFESMFQIVWVAGALVPAAIHLPMAVAAAMVLTGGVTATVLFAAGMRQISSVAPESDEVREGEEPDES